MDIQLSTEASSDLGELEVLEMDELQVSGSSTAYNYIARNADRSSDAPAG
ncbi:hypothetical protein [Streptomyces spectabilis]|uniref:Uncharacterized protein n=1 Tax=Streptomyces spectabilis TaxID=68270 RepID=A0A7W8AXV3_STRST|nr:hypothetical protein [Streptomyces spectabilis]MBB5105188.1 hypothetical protein [Streptomyces spectabilis]MCI3905914.1 hypothetical protein [Streptomyces spectabilis]GGV05909.1 hypothetical protein GCM10010245_12240 [Streptomyces spectabilis]